jgi:hypothetical protein
MPTVAINGVDYPSYIDVAYADEYLAADMSRAEAWAAVSADNKARAVITATRLLQRLIWKAGPPAVDTAADVVKEATALLAADIAAKPKLGDSGSTASNVKAVGAGSAKVEFFSPVEGAVLPSAAFALLRGLLGQDDVLLGGIGDATAFGSEPYRRSRFDETDYGSVYGTPNPDERLL